MRIRAEQRTAEGRVRRLVDTDGERSRQRRRRIVVERELPARDWPLLDRRSEAEAGQRRFKREGDRATRHIKDHNVGRVRAPERRDAVVQLLPKLPDLLLDLKVPGNGGRLVLVRHIADISLRILEFLDLVGETLALWWNCQLPALRITKAQLT